ncbi:MAG: XkdF-like putative serine protease domain-containing protein [Acidimicrobiia bacterium]
MANPKRRAMSATDRAPVTTKFYVPIAKVSTTEERTITGVVLQPEVVDAQGDIMDSAVIRKAAHAFLAGYNTRTKPGLMHKDFKPRFEIVESYLAPQELTINGKMVSEGSWVMTMKVLDDKVWDQIKKGKLTGFSIGGKARVQKLTPKAAA